MIITDISPQKRKKDRVNIFVDGKFSFSLDLETLTKNNLVVNQEISQEKIEKLIKEGEFVKLYDKAVKFLSSRPRSEKEVADYLKKKQAGEREILMVVAKLKKGGLVDDKQFINWWFEQRQSFKPRALRVIKLELLRRGVDKKIIDEALAEKGGNSDLEMARKIAKKAIKRYKNLPKREKYQKMSNFLSQRGFDWEIIKEVVDEILEKE